MPKFLFFKWLSSISPSVFNIAKNGVSALQFPWIVREYYKSGPRFESIKTLKIIEAKTGQKGRRSKRTTFLLNYLWILSGLNL